MVFISTILVCIWILLIIQWEQGNEWTKTQTGCEWHSSWLLVKGEWECPTPTPTVVP